MKTRLLTDAYTAFQHARNCSENILIHHSWMSSEGEQRATAWSLLAYENLRQLADAMGFDLVERRAEDGITPRQIGPDDREVEFVGLR